MEASSTRHRNQAGQPSLSSLRSRADSSSFASSHISSQRPPSSTGSYSVSSPASSSDSAGTAVPHDRQSAHDARDAGLEQEREGDTEHDDGLNGDEEDDESGDRHESGSVGGEDIDLDQLGSTHYLPLLFVALPLLGGAFLGRADSWSDGLVLVLVGFWMYFLLKTPWELYHSSLHHHLLTHPSSSHHSSVHHAHTSLSQTHNLFLLLTLLSPLLGSLLLHLTRTYALSPSASERYINSFNIRIFLLASSIKPVLNLTEVLRNRNAALRKMLGRPKEDEWQGLRRKVAELEAEVVALKAGKADKQQLGDLRDELGGKVIGDLGKAVRRQERRGELTRLSLSERVDLLSTQLLTVQGELDQVRTNASSQNHHAFTWLLSLLNLQNPPSFALASSSPSTRTSQLPRQPQLIHNRLPEQHTQSHRLQFTSQASSLPHLKTKLNQHPTPYPSARNEPLSPPSSLSEDDTSSPRIPGASPFIAAQRAKDRRSKTKTPSQASIPSALFGFFWRDLVMLPVQIGWTAAMLPVRVGLWVLRRIV